MTRTHRKLEHVKYAMKMGDGPQSAHFKDILFIHNCLPELNLADVDLSADFFGKHLKLPFLIDAITGGTDAVTEINASIAKVAAAAEVAMAVGSQYGTAKTGKSHASYTVVRKNNPNGLVFANVSAITTPEQAKLAVRMLDADALQIHLNPAQELIMREGNRNFRGLISNMLRIRDVLDVPIIVKETGCGIAAEEYKKLLAEGFKMFDCAGAGGTNFTAIEAARNGKCPEEAIFHWGLPTCWSMIDAATCCGADNLLIASGGIRTAEDIAKSFALGADLIGIAFPILSLIARKKDASAFLLEMGNRLSYYLMLLGCRTPVKLQKVPLIFTGTTKDYINCRRYNMAGLAKKGVKIVQTAMQKHGCFFIV
ncbi:MAG: type 2 isopentenyl-diphosphate Delta-isomerase [Phascolarctobacterium sp.]|nr:type 2 isopentenyl-diphosphate Delta-isomerase [Phascolarctobacterium sp.]